LVDGDILEATEGQKRIVAVSVAFSALLGLKSAVLLSLSVPNLIGAASMVYFGY
jgi:hypothetical protein